MIQTDQKADYNVLLRLIRLPRLYRLLRIFKLVKISKDLKKHEFVEKIVFNMLMNAGKVYLLNFEYNWIKKQLSE
jgi:hypothetical protein